MEKRLNIEKKEILEKAIKNRQEMEKRIELKLKDLKVLENKKVVNVSKNSFVLYNVNWFNVCCGFEKLTMIHLKDTNKKILDMGLVINENEIIISII